MDDIEQEKTAEEAEDLNEGTLSAIVRSILRRHNKPRPPKHSESESHGGSEGQGDPRSGE